MTMPCIYRFHSSALQVALAHRTLQAGETHGSLRNVGSVLRFDSPKSPICYRISITPFGSSFPPDTRVPLTLKMGAPRCSSSSKFPINTAVVFLSASLLPGETTAIFTHYFADPGQSGRDRTRCPASIVEQALARPSRGRARRTSPPSRPGSGFAGLARTWPRML